MDNQEMDRCLDVLFDSAVSDEEASRDVLLSMAKNGDLDFVQEGLAALLDGCEYARVHDRENLASICELTEDFCMTVAQRFAEVGEQFHAAAAEARESSGS